jgi:hypothetical protein
MVIKYRFTNMNGTKPCQNCQNVFTLLTHIPFMPQISVVCFSYTVNIFALLQVTISNRYFYAIFIFYIFYLLPLVPIFLSRYLRGGFMEILATKLKIVSVSAFSVSSPSDYICMGEGGWNVL